MSSWQNLSHNFMQNFTPLNYSKLHPDVKKTQSDHNQSSGKTIMKRRSLLPSIIVMTLLLFTIGVSVYFYYQYEETQKQLAKISSDNSQLITEMLGKLVLLPKDETPTIGTVTDKSQLPAKPFFKNAENGDKIVLFTLAKKVYLYRPSLNKIIDIGPVISEEGSVSGAKTTIRETTPSGKIIFRGTTPTPTIQQFISSPTLTPFPSTAPTSAPAP